MAKIRSIITNKYFGLTFSIGAILLMSFLNAFPKGYVFSYADAYQCVDCDRFSQNLLKYTWQDGNIGGGNTAYTYYPMLYFMNIVQNIIGLNNMSFFYFAFFLLGSFLSFRFSVGLFFEKKSEWMRNVISLSYAINPYLIIYYTSFYYGFIILYALIPLIFALTYKYFSNSNLFNKYLFYLSFIFYLSSISYGNPPFLISLNLFLFTFLVLLYFLFGRFTNPVAYIKKAIIYYIFYILISFPFIFPQIMTLSSIYNQFVSGTALFSLGAWILMSASRMTDVFTMLREPMSYIKDYSFFILIPGIAYFIFLTSVYIIKKVNKKTILFSIMLLVAIFLSNKGFGYLDNKLIQLIFTSNPFLSSIKSSDKTYFFVPFFLLISVYGFSIKSKIGRYVSSVVFVLLVISLYPYWSGRVMLNRGVADIGKDYKTSNYAALVKIPQEYFTVADKFNEKKEESRFLSLPWNVMNSVGWVNYPKWKLMGLDPTAHLFEQPTISISNTLDRWFYTKDWNMQDGEKSRWMLSLSGLFNSKYIIFHKDVDEKFLAETQDKIKYYEKNNLIRELENNDYFNLYKISDNFFLPHFYTPKNNFISQRVIEDLPRMMLQDNWQIRSAVFFEGQNVGKEEILKRVQNDNSKNSSLDSRLRGNDNEGEGDLLVVEFKKINPTKYRVKIHSAKGEFPLVFSESFHDGWKAYLAKPDNFQFSISNFQSIFNDQISKYKILDGNTDDQASKGELADFIKNGHVTTLGNLKEKTIKHQKWNEEKQKEELNYVEKYNIDFISKNFQGTIQNDNLPTGSFYETWLPASYKVKSSPREIPPKADQQSWISLGKSSYKDKLKSFFELNKNVVELPEEKHLMVNGYANSWIINTDELCNNPSYKVESYKVESGFCVQNPDGSYDFEMVVEFYPQRLFYIGVGISGMTLLFCLACLGYDYYRRKKCVKIKKDNK